MREVRETLKGVLSLVQRCMWALRSFTYTENKRERKRDHRLQSGVQRELGTHREGAGRDGGRERGTHERWLGA